VGAQDARLVAKIVELLGHVLAALVVMQSLDIPTQLVLRKRFKQLECTECVAFPPEQYDNSVARVVVDEHAPIPVSFRCRNRERAAEVGVDEVKRGRSAMSSGGKGRRMHFPSEAGLTNGIALHRRREGNASGQTIRDELLDVCRVVVAKAFMPELEVEWARCDCAGGLGGR
jgi:hypothetical protein